MSKSKTCRRSEASDDAPALPFEKDAWDDRNVAKFKFPDDATQPGEEFEAEAKTITGELWYEISKLDGTPLGLCHSSAQGNQALAPYGKVVNTDLLERWIEFRDLHARRCNWCGELVTATTISNRPAKCPDMHNVDGNDRFPRASGKS